MDKKTGCMIAITVVIIIAVGLFILAFATMGGAFSSMPRYPNNNSVLSVYHVETVTETWFSDKDRQNKTSQVSYAMVNDPADNESYKVVELSSVCMKTYRPEASILKVGDIGNSFADPPCEWLVVQKTAGIFSPDMESPNQNAILPVYHVERVTAAWDGRRTHQVGYAMISDPDDYGYFKVVFISPTCLKTYRPEASILKVGHTNGGEGDPPCEWLVTQK